MSDHYEISQRGGVISFVPKPCLEHLCAISYLVIDGDRAPVALIDPGNPLYAGLLRDALVEVGVYPKLIERIFYTHLHFDHVSDPRAFPNAVFFASLETLRCFQNSPQEELWRAYDRGRKEGESAKIFLENIQGRIIEPFETAGLARIGREDHTGRLNAEARNGGAYYVVGGHTQGSTAIILENSIFLGDSMGKRDAPTSSPSHNKKHFARLISNQPYTVFSGHDRVV